MPQIKLPKNDEQRLVSVIGQKSTAHKPKFYVGDFVRIVKKDKAFFKSYKQTFTDEVFEITGIPTLNPPTYSLVDADSKPYSRKILSTRITTCQAPSR